jgi:hypothetical protein
VGEHVKSKTLDEVALTVARIMWTEYPLTIDMNNVSDSLNDRIISGSENALLYDILFCANHWSGHEEGVRITEVSQINFHLFEKGRSDGGGEHNKLPTVSEFIDYLSKLESKLVVLADSIEAGAQL